ncbi:MAG: hypothetical protein MUP16_10035 [Sedimentisphaerales bacterium]|nr:hypothetical protein [Sedimentisphaerales bacterium]
MWVLLKSTYAGPLGMFIEGQKMDLPKEKVAAIRKAIGDKNVVDTCAPWEEGIDMKAAKHNAFLEKVHNAIAKAENLSTERDRLGCLIKDTIEKLKPIEQEYQNAVKEAKKLAKTAGIDWPA